MVSPLIIIIIIGIIGAGVVFTPMGDIVQDVLHQSGLTDPNAYKIVDNEEELESEVVGGFENFIHELIGAGRDIGQESIESTNFENNPIGMTKDEATNINEKGVDFFEAFAQVFFKGHAFIVAVINGLSPVEVGVALVSIIALLVSIFLMLSHAKHIGKHWAIIVMVVSFFILFFLVIGTNASL